MATLEGRPDLGLRISMSLSEAEARALEALAGYGSDAFLKVFYEHMGKAYLEPHEHGLRSLFEGIKENLPAICSRMDQAKKVFYDPRAKVYVEPPASAPVSTVAPTKANRERKKRREAT